jgi:hypothetical protein
MKEIRITFRSEDFAAVSKSMIDLGVSFQVEPVEPAEDEGPRSQAPRGRPGRRKGGRTARSGAAAEPVETGRPAGRESSGADRLRAMVERNRAAAGRATGEGEGGLTGGGPPGEPT